MVISFFLMFTYLICVFFKKGLKISLIFNNIPEYMLFYKFNRRCFYDYAKRNIV